MSEVARFNPTERFSGLAKVYNLYRPSYPEEAVGAVVKHCHLNMDSILVDIGCGTGISSRCFAKAGVNVVGIEPNADMRTKAAASYDELYEAMLIFVEGTAEATGLEDESIDAVLAAQAFHWFEQGKALEEFHRILKPGGWTIVMSNERDDNDTFTQAYGQVLKTLRDTMQIETPRREAGKVLFSSELFTNQDRFLFSNEQVLDEEGLIGRGFSNSNSPKDGETTAKFIVSLKDLFADYEVNGFVTIRYQTSVIVAQKRPA